ncbi:MAG: 4Fe-4S binding protein [Candidatus Lokiarchaeota archaeon]|nr:4Fe-4S binding protein [Candidatus Lokiarchaeota archaeon]
MARPLWFVKLLKKSFPNIKLIAKLTNLPILGFIFDYLLFRDDDIIYLPQDRTIEVGKALGDYSEIVLPSQVLKYFIEKANHHWIMNFCICRSSMKCEDYPIDLGCLFLGDAVLGINPQLGRLVSKEEALAHLKKCEEARLVHMIGRNRLDAQWLGVKPGEKLLSICNCDPCCCLWRVSPFLSTKIGRKIKKMPGVSVRVTDRCKGCKICTKGYCFVDAIHFVNEKAVISKECRGCGRCVSVCPHEAIEITIEDQDYVKKSIKELELIIDVG